MTGAGLCQFNIVVPNVPDGDQELVAVLRAVEQGPLFAGGPVPAYSTPGNLFVNVRR
jgi:hypothetical protein